MTRAVARVVVAREIRRGGVMAVSGKQAQGHRDGPLGRPIEGLYIRGAKPVAYGHTYTVLQ
jgi:hypothetical protein